MKGLSFARLVHNFSNTKKMIVKKYNKLNGKKFTILKESALLDKHQPTEAEAMITLETDHVGAPGWLRWLSICPWLRPRSLGPRTESHSGLPAQWVVCFSFSCSNE